MKKEKIIKLLMAIVGIMLVGSGIAFNASAALGNDPIGIMYDGIRSAVGLTLDQLGMASNLVNVVFVILVFWFGRHYINIGTFIYILPYGVAVDMGGQFYHAVFRVQTTASQIAGAVSGCLMLYAGVALFIVADIGLDPFTGFVMVLKDRFGSEYKTMKVLFDLVCVVLGFAMGGELGFITIITAFIAGPMIQLMTVGIRRWIWRIEACCGIRT